MISGGVTAANLPQAARNFCLSAEALSGSFVLVCISRSFHIKAATQINSGPPSRTRLQPSNREPCPIGTSADGLHQTDYDLRRDGGGGALMGSLCMLWKLPMRQSWVPPLSACSTSLLRCWSSSYRCSRLGVGSLKLSGRLFMGTPSH